MIDLTGRVVERREYADRVELDARDLTYLELADLAMAGFADVRVGDWVYEGGHLTGCEMRAADPSIYYMLFASRATFTPEKNMLVSAEKAAEIIRKGEYVKGKEVKRPYTLMRQTDGSYSVAGEYLRLLSYVDQALAGTYKTRANEVINASPISDGTTCLQLNGVLYELSREQAEQILSALA